MSIISTFVEAYSSSLRVLHLHCSSILLSSCWILKFHSPLIDIPLTLMVVNTDLTKDPHTVTHLVFSFRRSLLPTIRITEHITALHLKFPIPPPSALSLNRP